MPARTYDPFKTWVSSPYYGPDTGDPNREWSSEEEGYSPGYWVEKDPTETALMVAQKEARGAKYRGEEPSGLEMSGMEGYLTEFLKPESRRERRAIREAGVDVQAGDALRQLATVQASRGVAGRGAGAAQAQIMSGAIQAKAQLEAQGLQEASQIFDMVMKIEDFKLRELGVDLETRAYVLNATNEALAKVQEADKDSAGFYRQYNAIMTKYNRLIAQAEALGDFALVAQLVQEASNAIISTMG